MKEFENGCQCVQLQRALDVRDGQDSRVCIAFVKPSEDKREHRAKTNSEVG